MAGANDTFVGDFRHDAVGRKIIRAVTEDASLGAGVFAGRGYRASDGVEEIVFDGLATTADNESRVPKAGAQAAESQNTPVFKVTPFTSGAAPFQVEMQSYANDGAGAGTFNHGVWFGFNAAHYSQGTTVDDVSGIYMGFEDNYHDTAGADVGEEKYGPEWYIGYTSPDATTIPIAGLRPFYCRIKGGRVNQTAANTSVATWIDIGGGATGFFSIMAGQVAGVELAVFNKDTTYIRKQTQFTNDGVGLEVKPDNAAQVYAQLNINCQQAGGFPVVHFKTADVGRWSVVGGSAEFYFEDIQNASRKHIQLLPGASVNAAATIINSATRIEGAVGFNGAAAVGKQTLGAAATDLASVITLANNLRTALINTGLGQV